MELILEDLGEHPIFEGVTVKRVDLITLLTSYIQERDEDGRFG